MEFLRDSTQQLELRQKALAGISLAVARDTSLANDVDGELVRRGASRYVKAGDVATTGDLGATPPPASAALAAMINAEDLLGRLVGAIRLPLMMPGRLQVGSLAAAETAEGAATPVAVLTFGAATKPVEVRGTVVLSNETLLAVDTRTQDSILAMLVAACALASDTHVVGVLTAGSPASSADVGVLLAGISGGRPSKPCLIGGFDSLLGLAPGVLRDLGALGIPVLPCSAAGGLMIAVDAAGVLIGDSGAEVRTAHHATLDLDLSGGSPANPVPVSLWQSGLTALTGLRYVRVSVRAGAVAYANVGSPA
jgi:hypothetical protein